ncbi:MAG: flagellar protein FlaG [Deltaproteobacteria bacterium]|nr:flagellar protein FlaG [Deltaproteobacteria bacterium]
METTQSLKVQRFQTGFVDIKSMGYLASQNPEKAGIDPVQNLDQIDLRTRDQIDTKNQDQQKQTQNAEQAMPAMLKDLETKINQMQEVGLEFSQYKDSGKMIVKVVEKGTNKVIREIPSEEFLNLVEKMDQMIGILFDKKV